MVKFWAGIAFAITLGLSAHAIELSQSGASAMLRGEIKTGDDIIFREFLARPGAAQIRTLYLHSPGGKVLEAREIARIVRNAGMTTAVDASRAFCNSACTAIFSGGVRRLYLNANAVADGGAGNLGLGFHEGNNPRGPSGQKEYSGRASGEMINTYYEMGVGGAAALVTKANFNRLYRVSGPTALSLGIATSLSP
ncbi:hypothetical protein [Terrarubrum flagellatum]|uniref:hypothetical protein n=1 Tax=Terrirubrum flagellatum TaxID=2895980 RepID=UPI003145315C